MFYDKTVSIYNKAAGSKVNGIYVAGSPTFVKNILADVQTYSAELLLKDYGYNLDVTKRIFCDSDSDIKIGTTLIYNNVSYEVKAIPWDDNGFMEVVCFEYGI